MQLIPTATDAKNFTLVRLKGYSIAILFDYLFEECFLLGGGGGLMPLVLFIMGSCNFSCRLCAEWIFASKFLKVFFTSVEPMLTISYIQYVECGVAI
jgi:hypothetical protein